MSGAINGGRKRRAVLVADGDAKTRALTAALLKSAGFDVSEAANGREALQRARKREPALVILDVELPQISGYQVCHLLRQEYGQNLPILLLSTTRTEPYDKAAGLLLGADDYMAKPYDPSELLARVEVHTRAHQPTEGEELHAPGPETSLTPSELRVLRLLANGMDAKAIARELSIAPKTVAMHIHNAMKKLDVHSRTQAVALAHQLGLVEQSSAVQRPDIEVHGSPRTSG